MCGIPEWSIMAGRMITTERMEEDKAVEGSLRPKFLHEYIGQAKAKENLKIYIEAAKKRKENYHYMKSV